MICPLSIGVAVATVSLRPSGFVTLMKKLFCADCGVGLESVTPTVKTELGPSTVGVPLICPPLGSGPLNPAGSDPDSMLK